MIYGRSIKLIAWSLQAPALMPEEMHLLAVVEGPRAAMQVLPRTLLATTGRLCGIVCQFDEHRIRPKGRASA